MKDNLIHVNFNKQSEKQELMSDAELVIGNKNLIEETINFLNNIKVHNHEFKIENNKVLAKKVTDEEWANMGCVSSIEYIAMHEDGWVEFHYQEVEGELDALYINQYGIEA